MTFAERDEQMRRQRWEEMTGQKWPDNDVIEVQSGFKEIEQ